MKQNNIQFNKHRNINYHISINDNNNNVPTNGKMDVFGNKPHSQLGVL